ncbi:galactose mutarotase [Lentisphaerota bacterium ZTH]|nr:galactose mutarotase [Lentisphaerota bacterium]WET07298.1 galactose mutarotase [Lentisphaerota bacterium ZTH]
MEILQKNFGCLEDNRTVSLYTLQNNNGVSVDISDFGATIVTMNVPDKNNEFSNVVLGYDQPEDYFSNPFYFGSTVGRFCSRIANGRFTLNGKEYRLPLNDTGNHLHGGPGGLSHKLWDAEVDHDSEIPRLKLSCSSPDGENGYPGNLLVSVTYSLNNNNAISIEFEASSDKDTVINLTNHSYFNLAGAGSGSIMDHQLMINANFYLPITEDSIPKGEIHSVENTPFDFREMTRIASLLDFDHPQISRHYGYNHSFALNGHRNSVVLAAKVFEETSGRILEVFTSEPGLQFYTANYLDKRINGRNGSSYEPRHGLCLETQHYPDSPNHQSFPSTILEAGKTYRSNTIFKWSAENINITD